MGLRLGASSSQQAFEARADEELSHLITEFTNEINWHMRQHGLTRAKLAERMGVSPGRVSQILSGGENLTLRTLASLTTALDARCEVMLRSSDADVKGNERQPAASIEAPAEDYRPSRWAYRLRQSTADRR